MAQMQAKLGLSAVFVQSAALGPVVQPQCSHSRHNKCWLLNGVLSSYHAAVSAVGVLVDIFFISYLTKIRRTKNK